MVLAAKARRTAAVAIALGLFSMPALASPSAKLTFVRGSGAASCPDEHFLRSAVAERLGYDPFFAWARVTVIVELSRTPVGFHGRVQIVDDGGLALGERVLESKSEACEEAMAALALAISIALDDLENMLGRTADGSAAPASGAAPSGTLESDASRTALEPKPRNQPSASRRRRPAPDVITLSLGPTASLGLAPAPSIAEALAYAVRRGRWEVGVEFGASAPASYLEAAATRVEGHLTRATALGCAHAGLPFACLEATFGAFEAHADVPSPHSGIARYIGAGARVGIDLPLGSPHFFVRGFVAGALSLSPISVTVDRSAIYALPVASGTLGLALGAALF